MKLQRGAAPGGGPYFASLNIIRIFAATGVMVAHFLTHAHESLGLSSSRLDRLNFVDMFFVLSGFLLTQIYGEKVRSTEGYVRFLHQRLARLYPLHFLVTSAFVIAGLLLWRVGFQPRVAATFDFHWAPQHLLLIQSLNTTPVSALNSPTWSLSAEFFLLLTFPIFILLLDRYGTAMLIAGAVMIAAIFQVFQSIHGGPPWSEATYDYGLFRAMPSFMLGMAVADFLRRYPNLRVSWAAALLAGAAASCAVILDAPHELSIATYPVVIALACIAERRSRPRWLEHPSLTVLSNLTFGVFLLHTFVGILAVAVIRKLDIAGAPEVLLVLALATAFTFAMAGIVYHAIEIPARRMMSRLFDGHATAGATTGDIVNSTVPPSAGDTWFRESRPVALSLALSLLLSAAAFTWSGRV